MESLLSDWRRWSRAERSFVVVACILLSIAALTGLVVLH
jgi:hypothetical protein